MKVADALLQGARRLRAAGIDQPRLEARLLLGHALGRGSAALIACGPELVPVGAFDALLARREAKEPLAYITGTKEFWSLPFAVSPATLIPRPDSETVVAAALAARPDDGRPLQVLDLGTGTGCLILAILHERPAAYGVGVDLAPEAVVLAARNAAALGLAGRVAFVCGDWASCLLGPFDLVVGNPPYVRSAEMTRLMPDVMQYEPQLALDGGSDGLAAYRRIITGLADWLAPHGAAVLELGIGQAEDVTVLARDAGFTAVIRPDLAGIPRALVLRRCHI